MAFCRKKQGETYLTFFLNDEKESKQSMSRALHSVQYRLRRGKRIADTALSTDYYTTTFVVRLLLFLCLQQQRKSNQKENAALCGFLLYSFLLHSKLVFFRFYTKTLLLTLMPFSCRHP